MIASMIRAFGQIFTDRPAPTVFAEGHGREPWRQDLDVSRTVGWFTTIYPVSAGDYKSPIDLLCKTKDRRKSIPNNGWSYLTSSYHNTKGRETFRAHENMEVLFNYLGNNTTSFNKGSILDPTTEFDDIASFTQSNVPRLALFEINAAVEDAKLQLSFAWSRHLGRQDEISRWVTGVQDSLLFYAMTLPDAIPRMTLSDFPLLPLSEQSLLKMVEDVKIRSGLQEPIIEAAYPSTPVQDGILLGQMKDNSNYGINFQWKMSSRNLARPMTTESIARAWGLLVKHHQILRTVFIPSVRPQGIYDQVVVSNLEASITIIESTERLDVTRPVNTEHTDTLHSTKSPLHSLELYYSDVDEVTCQLSISHALVDGTSMALLLEQLISNVADVKVERALSLPFQAYVERMHSHSTETIVELWKERLAGLTPCHISQDSYGGGTRGTYPDSVEISLDKGLCRSIFDFSRTFSLTPATIFQLAWGLVLRAYTNSDDVCFGYLSSDRDMPLDGIEEAIGPYISMLISRISLSHDTALMKAMKSLQQDYLNIKEHQGASLASIQHALGLSDKPLFNTVLSIQRQRPGRSLSMEDIAFESISKNDPTEYAYVVNIFMDGEEGISLDLSHWRHEISPEMASSVAHSLVQAITLAIEKPEERMAAISVCSALDMEAQQAWNKPHDPPIAETCLHARLSEQAEQIPASQAITAADADLSYAALEELSTKLAAHLKQLGVSKEVLVPIYFEKSALAIVCMLAILKSGGAIVPLDPSHPQNGSQPLFEQLVPS
ncbi:Nonribosomal peptide synthetase 12 [Fusarium culmorum]|uniref:Nonribosomal peptide synthetase 12 n=1 Tax=Fusarium culmorum TaxID=5516 RepID=A0A2T4GGN8_FUSCU|nr:Nonribosomal peptide synthetase 12 [Fusarium culmorum]